MRVVAIFCFLLAAAVAVSPAFSTKKPEWEAVDNNLMKPGSVWNSMQPGDLQTNAWYENLVLGDGYGLANVYPYIVKRNSLNSGLSISFPGAKLDTSRVTKTPFMEDLTLSAAEGPFDKYIVTAADHLSVTMEFSLMEGKNKMTVPLVRGAAFISAKVESAMPQITSSRSFVSVKMADGT